MMIMSVCILLMTYADVYSNPLMTELGDVLVLVCEDNTSNLLIQVCIMSFLEYIRTYPPIRAYS